MCLFLVTGTSWDESISNIWDVLVSRRYDNMLVATSIRGHPSSLL